MSNTDDLSRFAPPKKGPAKKQAPRSSARSAPKPRKTNKRPPADVTLQPGMLCRIERLAWGIVPLGALIYAAYYFFAFGLSDLTSTAIIGIVVLGIPLLAFGLYGAPSSLYWGIKNPPVVISSEGILHCPPRGFQQVLVPWETFRGLRKYDDERGRSTALRVFSGPPYAYGLALTAIGLRTRRPRRAAKKTAVALVIPRNILNTDNDKVRKIIHSHHQWWLKTNSSVESQKAGLALDSSTQEQRLTGILASLAAKAEPTQLGTDTIFLPERRRTFVAKAIGSIGGGLLLVATGILAAIGMFIDEESDAGVAAYIISAGFIVVGVAILVEGFKAIRFLYMPPCLAITPQGLSLLPQQVSIPWEEYDGVRFTPSSGWSACSVEKKHYDDEPKSRIEISVVDSAHLSAEDTAQLIQAYYLAWLDSATSTPTHPSMPYAHGVSPFHGL